ncbi:MAG: thioredoxin domain-containing protein [Mariniblastus sp.]|nr:thioredoxin domain-containing protein [Mariniblastus sp.]
MNETWLKPLAGIFLLLTACAPSPDPKAEVTQPAESGEQVEGGEPQLSVGETKPSGRHTNQLASETSPYLLMHAHNPVDWRPWSEESLALAQQEDKPIFLSIGYSSCHWCHVMERESFLDEEIAALLNEKFICIKVDREERPDVDVIYMESLQVLNQLMKNGRGGGWPLSMFLTPDAKPFFGGTYFPPRDGDRGAAVGFLTILQKVTEAWGTQRERVLSDSEVIADLTRRSLAGQAPAADAKIQSGWTALAQVGLRERFDLKYGGFRFDETNPQVPKFPEPGNLFFLIDQLQNNPDNLEAKQMLVTTCERMMLGGIYDHLGGGFHRYSVDRYWSIPHFEKMLYDNGQLATVYSEAYALTGRVDFKRVVEGILEYTTREMQDESGGFYSALDADSEGEEGKFYRWSREEIQLALEPGEYALFASVYGIDQEPNFEGEYYAPQLKLSWPETARQWSMTEGELEEKLAPIRKKLFDIRANRQRPLTDDKILASWNGLMIRGYADAGRVLDQPEYLETASQAANFILDKMVDDQGRLIRTVTNGQGKLNAYLEDYACMVDGLLALHRATSEQKWIEAATTIQKKQDELFWDDVQGGYFYTSGDHENLLARTKKQVDGAMPSGNSVSAGNLLYLADQNEEGAYRDRARRCVVAASPLIERAPVAAPRLLITAGQLVDSPEE